MRSAGRLECVTKEKDVPGHTDCSHCNDIFRRTACEALNSWTPTFGLLMQRQGHWLLVNTYVSSLEYRTVFFACNSPQWARTFSFTKFLYHTQWRSTVVNSPLDEWLAQNAFGICKFLQCSFNGKIFQTYNQDISLQPANGINIPAELMGFFDSPPCP
jgi:hypothetical protein